MPNTGIRCLPGASPPQDEGHQNTACPRGGRRRQALNATGKLQRTAPSAAGVLRAATVAAPPPRAASARTAPRRRCHARLSPSGCAARAACRRDGAQRTPAAGRISRVRAAAKKGAAEVHTRRSRGGRTQLREGGASTSVGPSPPASGAAGAEAEACCSH